MRLIAKTRKGLRDTHQYKSDKMETSNTGSRSDDENVHPDSISISITDQWLEIPNELWQEEILPCLNLKELAILRLIKKSTTGTPDITASFFEDYYQTFISNKQLRVPQDILTFKEAVRIANTNLFSSSKTNPLIVSLSEGVFDEKGERIDISVSMHILGSGRTKTILIGGIEIKKSSVHEIYVELKNMTLRGSKDSGVYSYVDFLVENVCVEHCMASGIVVMQPFDEEDITNDIVTMCTTPHICGTVINCEVKHCQWDGLGAYGKSKLYIKGTTTVHHNVMEGDDEDYGVHIDKCSIVHIDYPLSKEIVFTNNVCELEEDTNVTTCRNWGGLGQIIKKCAYQGVTSITYHGKHVTDDNPNGVSWL